MFGQLILFECWTRVVQCDAPARSPGCSLTYHKGRWRYGEVMPLYVYWFQWQRLRFFMGCGCIISVARVWCDEVLRLLMLLGQKRWPVLGASGLAARTCQLSDLTSSVDWNIMQLPELNSRLPTQICFFNSWIWQTTNVVSILAFCFHGRCSCEVVKCWADSLIIQSQEQYNGPKYSDRSRDISILRRFEY